jgi:hypothetical protein
LFQFVVAASLAQSVEAVGIAFQFAEAIDTCLALVLWLRALFFVLVVALVILTVYIFLCHVLGSTPCL